MRNIFDLFKQNKKTSTASYIRPKDLHKFSTPQPIEDIKIPINNKPNILFMDDNFGIIELVKEDISMLSVIMSNHRPSGERYEVLYNSLSDEEKEFLTLFKMSDYNFIFSTTNTCGMSVEKVIHNGLRVDMALLDIILGGVSITEEGSARIIDGIDIAYVLKQHNPNIVYKMYTACTLAEYSSEAIKYKQLFNHSISDDVIYKDSNLLLRRKEILKMFMGLKR